MKIIREKSFKVFYALSLSSARDISQSTKKNRLNNAYVTHLYDISK